MRRKVDYLTWVLVTLIILDNYGCDIELLKVVLNAVG